jgi:hypothetical protein
VVLFVISGFGQVLKKFAVRPDQSSLISHICKEKGEDRWLTLLIIEMSSKLAPKGLRVIKYTIILVCNCARTDVMIAIWPCFFRHG